MKMVYSNDNYFLVSNMKNLIEAQDIKTFIKNEFTQGAIGETSAVDAWPEVWVVNDEHYERAIEVVTLSQSHLNQPDWFCKSCEEENAPSFEICWHCQQEKS